MVVVFYNTSNIIKEEMLYKPMKLHPWMHITLRDTLKKQVQTSCVWYLSLFTAKRLSSLLSSLLYRFTMFISIIMYKNIIMHVSIVLVLEAVDDDGIGGAARPTMWHSHPLHTAAGQVRGGGKPGRARTLFFFLYRIASVAFCVCKELSGLPPLGQSPPPL